MGFLRHSPSDTNAAASYIGSLPLWLLDCFRPPFLPESFMLGWKLSPLSKAVRNCPCNTFSIAIASELICTNQSWEIWVYHINIEELVAGKWGFTLKSKWLKKKRKKEPHTRGSMKTTAFYSLFPPHYPHFLPTSLTKLLHSLRKYDVSAFPEFPLGFS